ncbi:MAG: hypothetical protein WC373_10870 [Smithella sp.]|jgi:hypothetical protein
MGHLFKKFYRENHDKFEASPVKENWETEREKLLTDNESLRAHADNLRMQLRQETARLNHADTEIERLKKLTASFKEDREKEYFRI